MPKQNLDKLDITILSMLSENARKPYLEISRECGVSGAAVHQRIQRLNAAGVILRSQCVIDPAALGYETSAFVGIIMSDPHHYDAVIKYLEGMPEVVECYCTGGRCDILVKMFARNNEHLLDMLINLQRKCNVRTQTMISFKQVFDRQSPVLNTLRKEENKK